MGMETADPCSSTCHPCLPVQCVSVFNHVFAVLGKADDVFNLFNKAYQLDTYRGVYEDERFDVRLPVPGELAVDTLSLIHI